MDWLLGLGLTLLLLAVVPYWQQLALKQDELWRELGADDDGSLYCREGLCSHDAPSEFCIPRRLDLGASGRSRLAPPAWCILTHNRDLPVTIDSSKGARLGVRSCP